MTNRGVLIGTLAGILALWGAWQLYSGWGLVSLDFENAPAGKVLASISRQGGIEIASNLDPSTPVTMKVHRVPALEALDILAVRTDSSWRLAYLGARNEAAIESALAAFRAGQTAEGWSGNGAGGFSTVQPMSGAPLDLRLVEWQPANGGALQQLLAQASEETGVYLSVPSDWSPQVDKPQGGRMADAAPSLFRQAGGVSREVFLLRGPAPDEPRGDDDSGWRGNRSWVGSPPASAAARERGSRDWGNPEAAAKRTEAQIKLLPPEEQKKAREDTGMMREFWQSVRELPEEQRREKAREFFSRPEIQERMEDRRLAREAKMTPQQRIDRSQRYWDRKAEAKYRGGGEQ
jgi:hypothetical protein